MNQFLEACGAMGPLLLNVEAAGVAGESRAYDLPFVLIGKDPRCDLRLDHPEVSSRHAYVQLVNGRLLCADLGSRSGVHQGGKRRRLGWLDRERAVRIGPYRIRLLSGDNHVPLDANDPEDVLGAAQARGAGKLLFELSHRSVRLSRREIAGGLALVGSAADCEVRLIDPSVTSYHCALVPTPEGVWVVDLLGQGGIRVNGHEVSYSRLSEGDSVQLGHSMIRLIAPAAEGSVVMDGPEPVRLTVVPEPPPIRISTPPPAASDTAAAWSPSGVNRLVEDKSDDGESYNSPMHWLEESPAHEDGFVFGKPSSHRRNGVAEGVLTSHAASTSTSMSRGGELALPMSQAVELVERVLAPMLGQVGVMRQQMVDELQRSRATMFEMFSALQQEQTSSLDHELDRIRRISQDLNLFRADLERQSQALSELHARLAAAESLPLPGLAVAQNASVTLSAPAPPPRLAAAVQVAIALPNRSAGVLPRWNLEDEPSAPEFSGTSSVRVGPATNGNGKNMLPAGSSVISAAPSRLERKGPLVIPSLPVPQVASRTADGVGSIILESGPTLRTYDENVHNQLCERIVQIREEHRGRWSRLLSMIPGSGSARSAP